VKAAAAPLSVQCLRLQLPPWPRDGAAPAPLRCGVRSDDGLWHDAGEIALAALASRFAARRVEAALHPADAPMLAFALPPLTGRRLREAVLGAVEPCALQPVEQLVVAFGPRDAQGRVPAAWAGRDAAAGWHALLHRHGLALGALHLPAAFLAMADDGWSGCEFDRWLVVRTGAGQGFVHWLAEGEDRAAVLAARAGDALPPATRWLDGDAASAAARWSGAGWNWALPAGGAGAGAAGVRLATLGVGWGALALAVWLVGLNLHAERLAAEGQAVKRQMAARVKSAFPDIPVVVDPLKQARQHKEARAAGEMPAAARDYASLSRAAAALLAEVPAGQVQSLGYAAGTLRLRWREGGAPEPEAWRALQARGRERGLLLEGDAAGMSLSAAAEGEAAAKAAVVAESAGGPP
jgi:general secretion pathway protein L